MTSILHERAPRVEIPADFPHPERLGGRDLFLAVLGNPAAATFARWLGEGKLPKPKKLGSLNRWPEVQMAAVRDAGIS
jgi:predicted DNA-binding transcriptional regulator AlpA